MDKPVGSVENLKQTHVEMSHKITTEENALETFLILKSEHPEAKCALEHNSPWQLLVATILSAQCTDIRVNQVTPELFWQFPDSQSMALADLSKLEKIIRPTGFFRNKAKNLRDCSKVLVQKHGGRVPPKMQELIKLPGVGRKTANVILGNAFNIPGMVVDTHVGRLSRRLGWTKQNDAVKIEQDLCKLLPARVWTQAAHVLIFHGRKCCSARKPGCSFCPVESRCPKVGVLSFK